MVAANADIAVSPEHFYDLLDLSDSEDTDIFFQTLVISGFWSSARYKSKYRDNCAGISMAGNMFQYLDLALPFTRSKYGWRPTDELRAMFDESGGVDDLLRERWPCNQNLLVNELINHALAYFDPVERHIGEVFCRAALISLHLIGIGKEGQEVPSPKLLELVRQARPNYKAN